MGIDGRIDEGIWNLLQEKDFNLKTMHMAKDSKAIVMANERLNLAGMDCKRVVLLSLEYINDSNLDDKDLNDTIRSSVNSYYDSEEYKNGLSYRRTIKK